MKIGYFQFNPVFGAKYTNIKKVSQKLQDKMLNCDLMVLPEFFNTGYNFISKKEVQNLSEKIPEGETTQALMSIAKNKNMFIVAGLPEKEKNYCFNSACIVGPDGFIAKYQKIHLFFREKLFFTTGKIKLNPIDIKKTKVGVLICFDWIFPEAMRTLALKGAQIIAHPTNLVLSFYQSASITRAIENRLFIVLANRWGYENRGKNSFSFTGKSQIVSPFGEILACSPSAKDEIKIVNIDPSKANDKNINKYNNLFKDRKPKFYV
jgi:predicted amidohydrolase